MTHYYEHRFSLSLREVKETYLLISYLWERWHHCWVLPWQRGVSIITNDQSDSHPSYLIRRGAECGWCESQIEGFKKQLDSFLDLFPSKLISTKKLEEFSFLSHKKHKCFSPVERRKQWGLFQSRGIPQVSYPHCRVHFQVSAILLAIIKWLKQHKKLGKKIWHKSRLIWGQRDGSSICPNCTQIWLFLTQQTLFFSTYLCSSVYQLYKQMCTLAHEVTNSDADLLVMVQTYESTSSLSYLSRFQPINQMFHSSLSMCVCSEPDAGEKNSGSSLNIWNVSVPKQISCFSKRA